MAQRQPTVLTDKASTNPVVSGAALTGELANVAYPETSSKRFMFDYAPTARASVQGATPTELFIGGTANFRFRPADTSAVVCKIHGVYCSATAANDTAFELTLAMQNRAGVVTILAGNTSTKMPAANAATLVPTIVGGNLVLTATGIAGDTNGRWSARLTCCEVTDLG